MRIALRTSGGRGEYEMAGTHGTTVTSDLFDKQILVELTPGVRFHTNNFVKNAQGKRRIRLVNSATDKHIYLVLAAILLLPRPKRQLSETGMGYFQLIDDMYSIADVQFDIVSINANEVVIRPTYIRLANSDNSKTLDVAQRMKLIFSLWEKANVGSNENLLGSLVKAHYAAYENRNILDLLTVIKPIRENIEADEDPLRQLLRKYSLSDNSTYDMGILTGVSEEFIDDNASSILESTQEMVRKWRLISCRGADGERFRKAVNQAYNNTCLFTGYYLPKTPLTGSAGVDAAHILPWATHGINTVQNGICLSKLSHWAFDAGLLKLTFDYSTNDYLVLVPDAIKQQGASLSLTPFIKLEGVIPKERLPQNPLMWPNPKFINEYNSVS